MQSGKLYQIIKLGRFHFLLAGFLVFSAGTLLATLLHGTFSWERFILGYAVLLPAHLSASYSNDYFDWKADHYNHPTTFAGGSGVLVENPELRKFSKNFSLFLMASSLILALIFYFLWSSLIFLIIAIFSILLAWYYSAPPVKLSYRGGGEIGTMITGFIFPTLGYTAITGFIDAQILLFTIPLMIYQLLFIIAVEIPDREGDIPGGKKNIVVKYGRRRSFSLILVLAIIGTFSFLLLGTTYVFKAINFNIVALISVITLLVSIYSFVRRSEDKKQATTFVNYLVASLLALILLTDLYFLSLISPYF